MSGTREWFGGIRKLDIDNATPEIDDVCCERMAIQLVQKCDMHESRYDCPDSLIQRVRGGYGLIVFGTDSVVEIGFCPWCGSRMPPIQDLNLPIGEENV